MSIVRHGADLMRTVTGQMADEQFIETVKKSPDEAEKMFELFQFQHEWELKEIANIVRKHGCLFSNLVPNNVAEIATVCFMVGLEETEVFVERYYYLRELKKIFPKLADYIQDNYIKDLQGTKEFCALLK